MKKKPSVNVKQLLYWNGRNLITFVTLYALMGLFILSPIIQSLLLLTIEKANLPYLTPQNLYLWLLSPVTIPLCFLIAIMVGYYFMIEFAALILHFNCAKQRERMGILSMAWLGLKEASRLLLPSNWLFVFVVLFLFPLTMLSLAPELIINLSIPEYMIDFLKQKLALRIVYAVVLIFFNVGAFYLFFCLCYFILEKDHFFSSCKKSIQLMKGHFFKILFSYAWWMLRVFLLTFLMNAGLLLLFVLWAKLFEQDPISHFLGDYITWKQLSIFLFSVFALIGTFSFMCYQYFQLSNEWHTAALPKEKISFRHIVYAIIQFGFLILVTGLFLDYRSGDTFSLDHPQLQVTAHRAGALDAPENTIAALRKAIDSEASMAEIDVQQTKDHQLLVMHDTDFKRVAHVQKNVWDVTAAEAQTFDVGSSFSPSYKGENIPLLEDMIQVADGKIQLMIELKINKHQKNLVETVLKVIHDNNFEKQCIVASMDEDILHEVKSQDPSITTAFITPVAYGNLSLMKDVDVFSIEATFVDLNIVTAIQKAGKEVYAWTVNEVATLKKMIELPLNGIITDNPYLANYYYETSVRNPLLDDFIQLFFPNEVNQLPLSEEIKPL